MVIAKEVELINKSLIDNYGIDTFSSLPIFRVVWSDEQFEKRLMECTDAGIQLLTPEVREVRKYWHWIRHRYILERLVLVPEHQQVELAGVKISYEPLWTFENSQGALPPTEQACKFIVDTVLSHQAVAKAMITGNERVDRPLTRYADPDSSQEVAKENQKKRIDNIVEELFGDQSSLGGSTYVTKDSIIVPRNFERTE